MKRRGFMLLLGAAFGASAGLWLPSTGIVTVPRRMVVALTGTCAFCQHAPPKVTTLAGVLGRPERICDGCIQLSLAILGEDLDAAPHREPPRSRSYADLDQGEQRAFERAFGSLHQPAAHTEKAELDDPELRAMLTRLWDASTRVAYAQEPLEASLALEYEQAQRDVKAALFERGERRAPPLVCTFCDARQDDVASLIAGPTVYICDGCVGDGAAIISDQLRA